jgi:hypothetical protein
MTNGKTHHKYCETGGCIRFVLDQLFATCARLISGAAQSREDAIVVYSGRPNAVRLIRDVSRLIWIKDQ